MTDLTVEQALPYACWAMLGGVVGSLARNRTLQLPSIYVRTRREDGSKIRMLDTGMLGGWIVAAFLGIVLDGTWLNATLYGVAVGYAGPSLAAQIIGALVDKTTLQLPRKRDKGNDPPAKPDD